MKKIYSFSLFILLMMLSFSAMAQLTNSAISGKVVDSKNETVPGVTVLIQNSSNGFKTGVATNMDGRFLVSNLSPGGPYVITVSFIGFKTIVKEIGNLSLGTTAKLDFVLQEDSKELTEVEIAASKTDRKFTNGNNISETQIKQLPTLNRSISDYTKTDARNSNNSFGGSSYRYNNITLDGAINNDAIGFSASLGGVSSTSGMPGGSTRSNPVSMDAIQDIQTAIAPFDVRLGNFTGGSINAVTRSGSNTVTGSIYSFGRNQAITGRSIDDHSKIGSSYYDYQTGFRIGLPIVKNKLFLFTNVEAARRQEPLFYGAGQSNSIMSVGLAQKIDSTLQAKYNYNVGDYGNYNINASSNKYFVRLDWQINDKHSVTLRNNTITSTADNLERSQNLFKFGSQDFRQYNNQIGTVAEVKSRFTNNLSNSLILGYSTIHDYRKVRDGATIFPQVQINNVGTGLNYTGNGTVMLGTDREAAIFNMYQNTLELTDNLIWYKGKHTFTFGTHNELYQIKYGFVNSWNGRIEYNNVNDFLADKPNRIRGSYYKGTEGNNSYDYNFNNPPAQFNVLLASTYVQDDIQATDKFKITPGVRVDFPIVPTSPALSSLVNATNDDPNLGTTYTHRSWKDFGEKIFGKAMISPRLGFVYDAKEWLTIRGGSGLFTGKIPFAWLGYAYYNNGVNYNTVDLNNIQKTPYPSTGNVYALNASPDSIYAHLPAGNKATTEVNLIDKNFKMPQVWRSSLAFDFKLPNDWKITIDGLYTKVITDVKFQNINLKDSVRYATSGPTQTPIYLSGGATKNKVSNAFSNAYLLTNTNQGYNYSLSIKLEKYFKFGLNAMAAYTYGHAYDISNGIRNSMQSNWELNPSMLANSPTLAYSNFDIRNRIVSSLSYRKQWNKNWISYLTLFFAGQSGSPFTYVYNNNFTGNGQQNVILAYIPATQNDIKLVAADANDKRTTDQIWAELDNYISNNSYLNNRRGQYTQRNAARTPWNNQLDLRFMQDFNIVKEGKIKHQLQLTFDILNVTNLLNKKWGRSYFVPNTNNSSVGFGLTQKGFTADGTPTFTFVKSSNTPYSIDQLASRWQGQLGLRYTF